MPSGFSICAVYRAISGNEIRLAPLYDLSSQPPYPDLIEQRVAMKIGDQHHTISAAREQALTDGLDRKIITSLAKQLIDHAKERRLTLNRGFIRRK
jgi:hypothetical protein